MERIAILHFTAPPAIGGVESVLAAQAIALRGAGIPVRIIAAEQTNLPDVERVVIPDLHPSRAAEPADLDRLLREALTGCTACWVHNAFTVYLHPPLTAALCRLAAEVPIRWVAWCEDVSAASAFWSGEAPLLPRRLRHVAISDQRRRDLARHHGVPEHEVTVISPPLSSPWPALGADARSILGGAGWAPGEPLIVIPSKLLPHKNLPYAVRAVAGLLADDFTPTLIITGAASPHEEDVSACLAGELHGLAASLQVPLGIPGTRSALTRHAMHDLLLAADVAFLPSLEEGFGLPILEALALRVPLVCSNIPVFHDVAGDSALFADPMRPDDGTRVLAQALNSAAARRRRQILASAGRFAREVVALAREGSVAFRGQGE